MRACVFGRKRERVCVWGGGCIESEKGKGVDRE